MEISLRSSGDIKYILERWDKYGYKIHEKKWRFYQHPGKVSEMINLNLYVQKYGIYTAKVRKNRRKTHTPL